MGKGKANPHKFPATGPAILLPSHPGLIQTELTNIITARQMRKFEIPQNINALLENQVLTLADRVARTTGIGATQYSNYHSW
jgi:hypothetical protein